MSEVVGYVGADEEWAFKFTSNDKIIIQKEHELLEDRTVWLEGSVC